MLTELGYIYTALKLNLKYFILPLKLFPRPWLSLSRGLYTLQRNQSHVDESEEALMGTRSVTCPRGGRRSGGTVSGHPGSQQTMRPKGGQQGRPGTQPRRVV